MKYSLRSLMVVVTLVAVVLGAWTARARYLWQMAAYHERQALDYIESKGTGFHRKEAEMVMDVLISTPGRVGEDDMTGVSEDAAFLRHCVLVGVYRRAIYRPWNLIDEAKPWEYSE